MSIPINTAQSGLLVEGTGKLSGIIVNSHTSGTIKLLDATGAAANAVGTITQSVGAATPAYHAQNVLTSTGASVAGTHPSTIFTKTGNFLDGTRASGYITSDATQPTVGQAVVLGARTYTFRALGGTGVNGATAVNVSLGNNTAETMKNLYQAFLTDPLFDVVHTSTYVITVTYKTIGTAGNVTATENSTHLAWDDGATLTGGTNAETITLGTKVYTFKDTIDTIASATACQVKIGATLTASLLNFKYAVNATPTFNIKSYSDGNSAHTQVICTASDATTFTLYGRTPGLTLNTVATTETTADGAFGDTTLGGGTGDSTAGVTTGAATVTIGAVVYTVVDVLSETLGASAVAYQVLKGVSEATMLDNLKAAINATGTAGTEYSTGTLVHPYFVATTNADDSQTIRSRAVGGDAFTAIINALATTATLANTAWAAATCGAGTGAANPSVTTSAATITINGRVYTAVLELSETLGATAVADQILWVTSEAVFLDNLKSAINASGTIGTDYSTGTEVNGDVVATTNANDSQVIQNKKAGLAGNAITTTATLTNYAWGAATLASGTGPTGKVLMNTYTLPTGSSVVAVEETEFVNGLYVTIGGTAADLTFLID